MSDKVNGSNVNHPPHYNSGKIEVIEFIEDQGFGPGFCRGNAIKYAARAGKKNKETEIEDLEKAVWYLKREIEILKASKESREPLRPNAMNPQQGTDVDPKENPYASVMRRLESLQRDQERKNLRPSSVTDALTSERTAHPTGFAENAETVGTMVLSKKTTVLSEKADLCFKSITGFSFEGEWVHIFAEGYKQIVVFRPKEDPEIFDYIGKKAYVKGGFAP